MFKTAMVRARIEPRLKERAEGMLDAMGLSVATAITLLYRQIIRCRALPFELHVPNAPTRRSMQAARLGRGVVAADSMDNLLAELDDGNGARGAKRKFPSGRRNLR